MKLFTFLLIAGLATYAYGQTCGNYTTCKTCTADNGCGWCGPTATCSAGTRQGPNTGVCYGEAWFYNFGNTPNPCPNCTSLDNCKSCLYHDADCMWCSASATCKEWGASLGCGPVDACPCDVYATCSTCLEDPNCFWCGGANSTCKNVGATCSMPQHTCPCGDNTDCRSCLDDVDQGCVWCDNEGTGLCQKPNDTCSVAMNCQAFCSASGTNCQTCNELNGCGWCEDTQSCVDASAGTCTGPLLHACPNCGAHKYCDPCRDDGCVWCENGECRQPGELENCLITHTCNTYCLLFADCETCSQADGCGWCDTIGACADADTASCPFVHACSGKSSKSSFDGGAFVGGMFLGLGLCAIGIGGFLFYRYKMNKKPGYSELH